MSSATASTPQERGATSPSDGAVTNKEEEIWSGEEDDDADGDGDGDNDGSPRRKRQKTGRPISVSCEKCKERKVGKCALHISLASFGCLWLTHNPLSR